MKTHPRGISHPEFSSNYVLGMCLYAEDAIRGGLEKKERKLSFIQKAKLE